MDESVMEKETRKWLGTIESNRKMLQFGKQELDEGNILNAKSILDSLKNNLLKTAKDYPEEMKEAMDQLVRDTNAAQSLLRELITPRKRLQMNEDNN
jgi:hypothetical protein